MLDPWPHIAFPAVCDGVPRPQWGSKIGTKDSSRLLTCNYAKCKTSDCMQACTRCEAHARGSCVSANSRHCVQTTTFPSLHRSWQFGWGIYTNTNSCSALPLTLVRTYTQKVTLQHLQFHVLPSLRPVFLLYSFSKT